MRAILIDPFARAVSEVFLPVERTVDAIATLLGTELPVVNVINPNTAVVFDYLGMVRPGAAYWRAPGQPALMNAAGRTLVIGVAPDGTFAGLDPSRTVEMTVAGVAWANERPVKSELGVVYQDNPGGTPSRLPNINRIVTWPDETAEDIPVPMQPAPPESQPAASPADPAPVPPRVYAIHEDDLGEFRTVTYGLRSDGKLIVKDTQPAKTLDEARSFVPNGHTMKPADGDTVDDTLVETWA